MRYELSDYEWTAIKPMLPNKPRGVRRVNDRRVLNGIFWVLRSGAPWRDLPENWRTTVPHHLLQSLRSLEPFGRVQQDLRRIGAQGRQAGSDHDRRHASEGAPHRHEPFKKGPVPRRIGRTKGGLNSKLHAVCDGGGRPLVMLLSEGQMSDYRGAALMLSALPKAKDLLADKGYDADWFRAALAKRGIAACIPSKSNRKLTIPHDATLYRQRHKIENMFGRIKDWRRVHTRYDRCAHTYFSAICIAAAVVFWL